MLHRSLQEGDIHRVANWTVANSAARTALSLVIQDIGKIAWQLDTDIFYLLKNNVGPVWVGIGSGGVASYRDLSDYAYDLAASTGLTFAVKSGGPIMKGGISTTLGVFTINLPDNDYRYIYFNASTGILIASISSIIPSNCLPIAKVTTLGGVITDVQDRRPSFVIQNPLSLIDLLDGGNDNTNTASLYYNFRGIKFLTPTGVVAVIANSAILGASSTSYIYANTATGIVSVSTVGFPAGCFPFAVVTTSAVGITSIVDSRAFVIAVPASASPPKIISIAVSDETTALSTGAAKITFRMPYAMTLSEIRGSLTTAQAAGALLSFNVKENGVTVFSTLPTFDNTEKTTVTAATASILSDIALADDSEITVDIMTIGDGTAKGFKVHLIGT